MEKNEREIVSPSPFLFSSPLCSKKIFIYKKYNGIGLLRNAAINTVEENSNSTLAQTGRAKASPDFSVCRPILYMLLLKRLLNQLR